MSRLKDLRIKNNMTQKELAKLTGIPLRSIQDYEADKRMHIKTMPVVTFWKLLDALKLTDEEINELLGGE